MRTKKWFSRTFGAPFYQLRFADGGGTDSAGEDDKGTGKKDESDTSGEDDGQGDSAVEEKKFTQSELDALIEKCLKREQKKWAKQQTAAPATKPTASADPAAAELPAGGSAAPAAAAPVDNTELLKAQRGLVEARAQLTAINSGINPTVAEDAVLLAIHEVEKDGDDLDDENVADALKDVLKRHPEWKAGKSESGTGFRVGAGGGDPKKATADMLNEAFGLGDSKKG